MPTPNLPVEYHFDIYKNSFVNDPTACFAASTPFMAVNVGDIIDITGSGYDVADDRWLKVRIIRHKIWEIEGSHVGHQIGVVVEEMPRQD